MHTWHWISSAVSLVCMILFSVTGITLNHADFFEASTEEQTTELKVPEEILQTLSLVTDGSNKQALPEQLIVWLDTQLDHELPLAQLIAEWNEYEIYLQQPVPGGDRWLSIDLDTGDLVYMATDRGVIAWLNDLHKGRNTSWVWLLFIDVFALATLVFCITGLLLLQIHSKRRTSTWYITGAGIVIPGLIAWLFI